MTAPAAPVVAKGLEGIIIADTRISKVDGQAGRLTYSGYDIADLATNATYEEVVYLLWNGRLPNRTQLDDFKQQLFAQMAVSSDVMALIRQLPASAHPMAILRTIVSTLGLFDPYADDNTPEANQRKALSLTAKMPTLIAAAMRLRDGKEPLSPRADLSLAQNFLYMATGKEPDPTATQAIDRYMILLADHEMNASTFTARAVTSTDSDMYSAVTAAVGSLKGPKHGGANEMAMRMFLEIEQSGLSVEDWFQQVRTGHRRIMGIGHRIYKTEDPRAVILRDYARTLAEKTGQARIYEIAYELELIARADPYFKERNLYPNVDYYSAIVLYCAGIPVDMFTPLFAMSRIAGWCAHIIEQWTDNRLMRPKSQYVGEMGLPWTPIDQRA